MSKNEKHKVPAQPAQEKGAPEPSKQSMEEAGDYFKQYRRSPESRRAVEPAQFGIERATRVLGWILLGLLGGGCLLGFVMTKLTS